MQPERATVTEDASPTDNDSQGAPRYDVMVAVVALVAMLGSWAWDSVSPSPGIHLLFDLLQVVVISIVIWQACDPFADAAQYLGEQFRIPGSVRGATLDAIASSMPELFSGILFVVVAVAMTDGSSTEMANAGSEGYGATVATCAGSAVYNMMLIPAICALVISWTRSEHPSIEVEPKVITRDGMWFVACEVVLIVFLYQAALSWWMAVVLMLMYVGYVLHLLLDARVYRRARKYVRETLQDIEAPTADQISEVLRQHQMRPGLALVSAVRREMAADGEESEAEVDEAGCCFGLFSIPLTIRSAWAVIAVSTFFAAVACYWLVEVTRDTATSLEVPIFFVAVIVAAAASSVPDTFLSIGAARRGDDDGAVSNAFGSNIFDICICLSIPLLVYAALNDWQPVSMTKDGEPLPGVMGLRILLCVLTLLTLAMMGHRLQLTRGKAIWLIVFYAIFVTYAVAGSLGWLAV